MATPGHSARATHDPLWGPLVALLASALVTIAAQQVCPLTCIHFLRASGDRQALEAFSGCSSLVNAAIALSIDVGIGCSIIVSHYGGADDEQHLSSAMHTGLALALVVGLTVTVGGLLATEPIFGLLGTKPELVRASLAFAYPFLGALVLPVLFNMAVALQRAAGDVVRPALVSVLVCLTHMGLCAVLVGYLEMGLVGAAWSFIGAYLVGCVSEIAMLVHTRAAWCLRPAQMRISMPIARDMLACALPFVVQYSLSRFSGPMLRDAVTSFGSETVASWGVTVRLATPVRLLSDALAVAATTLSAQHFGAARYPQMRRVLHASLLAGLVLMGTAATLVCLFATPLVAHLASQPDVAALASTIVLFTIPWYVLYACMGNIAGVIRGSGESLRPTLIVLLGTFVLRVAWLWRVVPTYHSIVTVIMAYPLTWGVTTILLMLYYRHGRWMTRALRRARHRRARV